MFDVNEANEAVEYILSSMRHYPVGYVSGYVSTLGGSHRPSVLLTISLDSKEDWPHGILNNSRYAKFMIDYDGTMEMLSHHGVAKFRKARVSDAGQVVQKLVRWVEKSLVGGA